MTKTYQTKQNPIKWIQLVLLWLMLIIGNTIKAQPCNMLSTTLDDFPAGTAINGSEIILPAVRVGVLTSFSIPINVTDFSTSTAAVSGSCDDITNNQTINAVGNALEVTINKRCPLGEDNYLSFIYRITKTGCDDESKTFVVPVIRDTAKIVLTLDISGSMNSNVTGTADKRIDALKTAVNAFVPKLEEFQMEGDSLGLTYFSSITYEPDDDYFGKEFVKITNNEESTATNYASYKVESDLATRNPMQMTAMGLGLLNAKEKLLKYNKPNSNTKKMVFLFTDGLQNYGPRVNIDGNSLNNDDSLNNKSASNRDSIKYFTIATWEAGTAPEILNSIATKSGGQAMHVIGDAIDLNEWFNTNLYNLLNEGSPQIAFVKKGNRLDNKATINFKLNENIGKMLIEVYSKNDDSISLLLTKGNYTVKPTKINNGNGFKLFSFHFPRKINSNTTLNSGGEWTATLTGKSSLPYTVTAIVDDHLFKFKCSLNKPIFTVGDTLKIKTKISYSGKPINENCKVTAIILKPGDDVGHLLATYPTPRLKSHTDITSAANLKFQALMERNIKFKKALTPKNHTVELKSLGDGLFGGQFLSTELTGVYNIIYLIEANINGIGRIERTTTQSTVFKFGNVEPEKPKIDIININGGRKNLVVNIMPKNKYGYLMGPGFIPTQGNGSSLKSNKKQPFLEIGSAIKVEVLGSTIKTKDTKNKSLQQDDAIYIDEIKDNLDGSYSIIVANVPENTNPEINIAVKDEPLYKGKVWPVPMWLYLLVILFSILLLLLRYSKSSKKNIYRALLLAITIGLLIIIYLQSKGVVNFF